MTCTVVSIYPRDITEVKPGQTPNTFQIAASKGKEPQVLYVENGIDHRFVGGHFQSIPVPTEAEDIARSIVEDFVTSTILSDATAHPGLFWLKGKLSADVVKATPEYKAACSKQVLWYMRLLKDAQDTWAKTKQHKFISDLHRDAARELGATAEWMAAAEDMKTERCPVCTVPVTVDAVICTNCKVVLDKDKYSQFTFAGQVAPTPQVSK